jgi:quercetin dioxygenase-like cupin family protein
MKILNFRIIQWLGLCFGILFNLQAQKQMEPNTIFLKGDKLTNDYFVGDAFLKVLLNRDKNNDFVMGNVTFEPGARTNWHTHPKGQVLIVTSGEGFYQEKGKPAQIIKKGDIINIPENTEHWHGASAKTGMIHIAITHFKDDVNVVWLHPVSDDEYQEVNKNNKP